MGFLLEFTDIYQFRPDPESFDANRDLVLIRFQEARQQLYVSLLGTWAIASDDPSIPDSFSQVLADPRFRFRTPQGIRVDKAQVGAQALFSVVGKPDRNLWRSDVEVASLQPVIRRKTMRSNLRLRGRH